MPSLDMSNTCIKWGKGAAFNVNIGTIGRWGAERYRTMKDNKWRFLITSTTGPRYQHFDNRDFETKEDLDVAILEWICSAKA